MNDRDAGKSVTQPWMHAARMHGDSQSDGGPGCGWTCGTCKREML